MYLFVLQDNIILHSKEFVSQIFENNASVFICGDAKNMGRDVNEAIVAAVQKEKGNLTFFILFYFILFMFYLVYLFIFCSNLIQHDWEYFPFRR